MWIETSEGLETSLAPLYWTRILLATELLPLLANSSSVRPSTTREWLVTCFEDPGFSLDDLDLRNSMTFSTIQVAQQASTIDTLSLNRLAADPANNYIVFIHNHLGGVKLDIYKNGWDKKPIDFAVVPSAVLNGISPEFREEDLYLITSS